MSIRRKRAAPEMRRAFWDLKPLYTELLMSGTGRPLPQQEKNGRQSVKNALSSHSQHHLFIFRLQQQYDILTPQVIVLFCTSIYLSLEHRPTIQKIFIHKNIHHNNNSF